MIHSRKASEKSFFQKAMAYFVLAIMNVSPFINNIVLYKNYSSLATLTGGLTVLTSPGLFADPLDDMDLTVEQKEWKDAYGTIYNAKEAGGDAKEFFNSILDGGIKGGDILGGFNTQTGELYLGKDGDGEDIIVSGDGLTRGKETNVDETDNKQYFNSNGDEIKETLVDKQQSLRTENSSQGDAFRLIYNCEIDKDDPTKSSCGDGPNRSDKWKEVVKSVKNDDSGIVSYGNSILKQANDGDYLDADGNSLAGDCKETTAKVRSSKKKWVEDIQQCFAAEIPPIEGSCKVTREIKNLIPFTNINHFSHGSVPTKVEIVDNKLKFSVPDNAYWPGNTCANYNSTLTFDIENLNAITDFRLNRILVDDHVAIIINGTPVYGNNGYGNNKNMTAGEPRALVVDHQRNFKRGLCYSWDERSGYSRDKSRSSEWDHIENDFATSYDGRYDNILMAQFFKNLQEHDIQECIDNNAKTSEVMGDEDFVGAVNDSGYHIIYTTEHWWAEPDMDIRMSGRRAQRVITSQSDADIWNEYSAPNAYLGAPPYRGGGGEVYSSFNVSQCELSRSGNFSENLYLKPYLKEGPNTIEFELAVGGGGEIGVDFTITSESYTDVITEEPENCSSNPPSGWSAKNVEGAEIGNGSNLAWECTDLDNSREFEGVEIRPGAHGFMFKHGDPPRSSMFDSDDPEKNICYEAVARNYTNDMSNAGDDGGYFKQNGDFVALDPGSINNLKTNTCDKPVAKSCETVNDELVCEYKKSCQWDDNLGKEVCDGSALSERCTLIEEATKCAETDNNGKCVLETRQYDCGGWHTEESVVTKKGLACPGSLVCLGQACFTNQEPEENNDFEKVVGFLETAKEISKEGAGGCDFNRDYAPDPDREGYKLPNPRDLAASSCSCSLMDNPDYIDDTNDPDYDPDLTKQIVDVNTCNIFTGESMHCTAYKDPQLGLLKVNNCCDKPEGVNFTHYMATYSILDDLGYVNKAIDFAYSTTTSSATAAEFWADGAGSGVDKFLTNGWNTAVDSINSALGTSIEGMKTAAELAAEGASGLAGDQAVGVVGKAIYNLLPKDLAANFFEKGVEGTIELTELGADISQVFGQIMFYYQVYQAVMMIYKMIYSCKDSEIQMGYKRVVKSCSSGISRDRTGEPITRENQNGDTVYVKSEVRTFCASKSWFGGCDQRRSTSCCFSGPLPRILAEQADLQLGTPSDPNYDPDFKGFGSAKNPSCDSLKVIDLERLDWDRVDMSEYIDILKTNNLIPSMENAEDIYDMDGSTKGAGRKINDFKRLRGDEVECTLLEEKDENGDVVLDDKGKAVMYCPEEDNNAVNRSKMLTENKDVELGRKILEECAYKDVFGISLSGSSGTCVYDCGDNSVWDQAKQTCQCNVGFYENALGKCSKVLACEAHQEFSVNASGHGQCQCRMEDKYLASGWSATVRKEVTDRNINHSGSADTCDGDFINAYTSTDKECIDVQRTYSNWRGFPNWHHETDWRSRTFYKTQGCVEPKPRQLNTAECFSIENNIEKNACIGSCNSSSLNPEEKAQCSLIRNTCEFTLVPSHSKGDEPIRPYETTQCASDILSGINNPSNSCNEFTDTIEKYACLGSCSDFGLSNFSSLTRCTILEGKCASYENYDDRVACIKSLKSGAGFYAEKKCRGVEDLQSCLDNALPLFTDKVTEGWCSSNVDKEEFCASNYFDSALGEYNICEGVVDETPRDSEVCELYKDETFDNTVKYTDAELAEFEQQLNSLVDIVNNEEGWLISIGQRINITNDDSDISFDVFNVGKREERGVLYFKYNSSSAESYESIVEFSMGVEGRPGYRHLFTPTSKIKEEILNYIN